MPAHNFRARGAFATCALCLTFALFSLFSAVRLNAQSIGTNAGSTQNVIVFPGTAMTVPLVIDIANANGATISSLSAGVTWASSKLTFNSITPVGATGWTFAPITTNAGSGSVTFVSSNPSALPATSTLANVAFTAGATLGGTRVNLTPTSAGNVSGQSILGFVLPKALDVCVAITGLWGDATNDGTVNIIDAQQIARFSVGLSVANTNAVTLRSDVTNDGNVNIIDAQQIARFSVSLTTTPRTNTSSYVAPVVATMTTTPNTTQSLAVGATLGATATPRDGSNVDLTGCASVTWGSSNTAIATVSADGVISGIAPGTVTITAASVTQPGVTATFSVTVSGTPIIRTSIFHAGLAARQYVAQISGPGITGFLSYTFSGASMHGATMDLAVPGGTGTYIVRVAALAAAAANPLFLVGGQISLNVPTSASGLISQSLGLSAATFTMSTLPTTVATNATIPVAWSITDPSGLLDGRGTSLFCGAVNASSSTFATDFAGAQTNACTGLTHPSAGVLGYNTSIPGLASAGTVLLQTWAGQNVQFGAADQFLYFMNPSISRGETPLSVNVVQVGTVAVTPATPTVAVGGTLQMIGTARDASNVVINGLTTTWLSSTPTVATVSATGLITGIANGPTTITATIGGVPGNTTVNVSGGINVGSITVAALAPLTGNGSESAIATVRDPSNNVINAAVTWGSTSPMVARVASDGTVTALGTGTTNITATIGAVTGSQPLTVNQAPANFTITVRYVVGTTPSAAVQTAFNTAATRWAQVIRGADSPVTLTNFDISASCLGQTAGTTVLNETITNLVVYANIAQIDGVGGILGQAGPCFTRSGTGHAYIGRMTFDSDDLANMQANGTLTPVILHEMGHVLGIGTNWSNTGLLTDAMPSASNDPIFTGASAQWAFQFLGTGYAGRPVPVENCIGISGCGGGTINSHWREGILVHELMTGYVSPSGQPNPLSPLTAASLLDIGYSVDVSQSDIQPWFLRAGPPAPTVRIPINEQLLPPPIVTDLRGNVVAGGGANALRGPAAPVKPPPKHD